MMIASQPASRCKRVITRECLIAYVVLVVFTLFGDSILGVLGIYLGQTYDETQPRPLYVINHTTFDE